MDAVTTYSYGSFVSESYTKVTEGLTIPNPKTNRNTFVYNFRRQSLARNSRKSYGTIV